MQGVGYWGLAILRIEKDASPLDKFLYAPLYLYIYNSGKGILKQNKKHWLIDFWHYIKGCEEYNNNCNT